ncbi:hypothetical protein [Streptomyces sp. JJ36]|uniref:hypothetical protein n=1 Tax=Streptomyces sp. JJ36 TaxID=2736645 RepID=UPI001F388FEA|nr:hypothetical protein [Streptomyces sp. JJ36]MCF6521534.1 hypothetical protein [Streptomyces sp. JJ36]
MHSGTGRRHPLLGYLLDAVEGRFPSADGRVTVVPALPGGLEASVAFTGHAVVATSLAAEDVRAQGPDGFGGSLAPGFLRYLAGPGGEIGTLDVTLAARGAGGPSRLAPLPEGTEHPRIVHARSLRTHVSLWGDQRGLVTLADGAAGRRELSIELWDPAGGPARAGRSLLADALTLVPFGEPVFAAVSPGNARSLRAFLACGFQPLGSEVLLRPDRPQG